MPTQPDRHAALEQYRRRSGVYDLELALFEPIRREAIAQLAPRPGETVIDFGCGTGLSLPLVRAAVGAKGHVVGIEQSPDMIERARQRVAIQRWRNVELICAPAETAQWSGKADAALFHFTHDLLQRPEAVANALGMLRDGARVVASGLRWAPRWALAVNAGVYLAARRSITTLAGLEQPWKELERQLGPMRSRSRLLAAVYIAHGQRR
ncbi:MAG: class I SAM-dependent methyltransferase [Burkholderiales bacterium]|nr:class I SAM-dependent methyltransferase [Burkholderiales bacterium]